MDINQILNLIGAALLLVAYLGLSLGKYEATNKTYNIFNFIGAAILGYTAFYARQWGFVILETVWSLVALKQLLAK